MNFSTKERLCHLCYQFLIVLLHCNNGAPEVFNGDIPYPLRPSPSLPYLSSGMLRELLVSLLIQRVPQVFLPAQSSKHIPWCTFFFVVANSRIIGASSGFIRNWHVGACDFSPWVNTRLLSLYSPYVFTYPLLLYSSRIFTRPLPLYSPRIFICPLCSRCPRVFTRPLCPYSPRVNTRPLWGRCMLPTCRPIPLCIGRCRALWGMLGFTVSLVVCVWGSLLLTSSWLAPLWLWLSWTLGV